MNNMKRTDWLLIYTSLIGTLVIDQISKEWATGLVSLKFYGPLGLTLHHNPGMMLGMFSDLPPILRVVSLSTGGVFLLFCFFVIQYLLPIKSMLLRTGLSILIGGILGNVIDRILHGHVTDFLILRYGELSTGIFNIADSLQWVAYFMIVFALYRDGEILWPENNRRGRLWVKPKFQFKYCLTLVFAGLAFSLISGVFSYTFLRVTLLEPYEKFSSPDKILTSFSINFFILSMIFGVVMFIVGLRLSHRTAGPLYAFEKYLKDLTQGQKRNFKLRVGDDFPELERIAQHILGELDKVRSETSESPDTENNSVEEVDTPEEKTI